MRALWLSQGGERGWLGPALMPLYCGLPAGGCFQQFRGGSIYWHPATGAHYIRGMIRDRWGAAGWESGRLGYPTSSEFCGLRGGGCGQRFQGGLILWHPHVGAQAVWGAVHGGYAGLAFESGRLGYPTSAEMCGLRDGGCSQRFQGGVLFWSARTGAHPVWGAMLGRYAGEPFENGRLGYPTSGEFCGLRDGGCGQRFQGGNIYYHPSAGTRVVLGAIMTAYAGSSWEAGPLGYPTSDEFCGLVQSGCGQRFQRGLILWSPGTGPHPVRGAILEQYARQGYERGALGYPRAAESTANRVATQQFQNGQLRYSFVTGQVSLPNGGYPDHDAVPCGTVWCKFGYQYSARGFAYRNCTDFVAWRKGMVWSQINGRGDGHARGWRQGWIDRGRPVSNVPQIGSIAWWGTSRGGGYGHVGIVVGINPDGSVNVEHYNFNIRGGHSITNNLRAEAYLH